MNKYVKEFFIRGVIFGGLGPIVLGMVFSVLGFCNVEINLEGWQILLGIVSTYLMAFVQAGGSVFEQIEEWSAFKSALVHLSSVYAVYLFAYLVNRWIPYNWIVIAVFTFAIVVTFIIIWLICYSVNRSYQKKLNSILR